MSEPTDPTRSTGPSGPAPRPRDSVAALDGEPTVVSVSDVHGRRDRFESALLTLADHPDHESLVDRDADGDLRWAGNDYVLVCNGDLVNHGPDSDGTLGLLRRLREAAPPRRVRYHLGNHECLLLFRDVAPDEGTDPYWSDRASPVELSRFHEEALAGHLAVAYAGHRFDYVHAGSAEAIDPAALNDAFSHAVERLAAAHGTDRAADAQRETFVAHPRLFSPTRTGLPAPFDAHPDVTGVVWRWAEHLPESAPRQVVGHSPHERPTRRGDVIHQDTIRENVGSPGGECVVVETPDSVRALVRTGDGGVRKVALDR
ncbi:metallophosphoesterase [Halobium salinum]|uniref:Metallophosphoesterase n=1 Tax=Halobium salinum TaxID=1364940 RepID=A0ABD5PCC9_9EURY|nr:metallophosphoesterase [Halobium salinum]